MKYVGAIDQGTSSTRFMVFDSSGTVVGSCQREHEQVRWKDLHWRVKSVDGSSFLTHALTHPPLLRLRYIGIGSYAFLSFSPILQHYPQPGWVEHDAMEIWDKTQEVIAGGLKDAKIKADQLAGVGITNQRETTVVWNKKTGKPYHNAVVWNDVRTAETAKALEGKAGPDR